MRLEIAVGSCSNKRFGYDDKSEHPVSKRTYVSSSSFDELKAENNRLKKQLEMYKNEWMRTYYSPYYRIFLS